MTKMLQKLKIFEINPGVFFHRMTINKNHNIGIDINERHLRKIENFGTFHVQKSSCLLPIFGIDFYVRKKRSKVHIIFGELAVDAFVTDFYESISSVNK